MVPKDCHFEETSENQPWERTNYLYGFQGLWVLGLWKPKSIPIGCQTIYRQRVETVVSKSWKHASTLINGPLRTVAQQDYGHYCEPLSEQAWEAKGTTR